MDTRCGRNDFLATLLKALEDDPISCLEQFIFLNNDAPVVNNALDVAQTALKFKDVSFFSDLYEAGDSSHAKIVESNIAKNRFDDIINIQVRGYRCPTVVLQEDSFCINGTVWKPNLSSRRELQERRRLQCSQVLGL